MIKKTLSLLRRRIWRVPLYVPLAILAAGAIALAVVFGGGEAAPLQTVTASRGTVREEVSVVGRIQPTERLDLSLQGSGRVAFVGTSEGARVRRGQMLVSLSNANLQAQLQSAQAGLEQQQARLDQILAGSRAEDINVTRTTRDNAQRALESQLRESFTSVDSAFGANVDQLYKDPRTSSPEFGSRITSGSTRYFINASANDRIRLENGQAETIKRIVAWQEALAGGDTEAILLAAERTTTYAQTYLADLASVINAYRAENTTQQAIYDGFKNDVASARSTVSAADGAITAAAATRASAESQLSLKTAPAESADVRVQEAAVRGAEAQVALVRASIAENAVISPVDGIVTELSAKVGESASAAKPVVTVMSDARLEIEANVPEADIAKVAVGNEARVTLDAYSGETFAAHVIYVAPAETLTEGVATYKVKLQLDKDDARFKPGMSADLDIATQTRENVILLPQRAVISKSDKKVVRIPDGDSTREIEVRTGIRGVDGMIEIIAGVQEGEVVVTGTAK